MEMAFQTIAKNALEQETEVFIYLANIRWEMLMSLYFQAELINDFPDQIRLSPDNNRPGNADNCQC